MDRPPGRLVAATCVVWLALAGSAARAELIPADQLQNAIPHAACTPPVDCPDHGAGGPHILPYPWWPGWPSCPTPPYYGPAGPCLPTPPICPPWTPQTPPTTGTPSDVGHAPAPSSLVLLGLGSLGLIGLRRRRSSKCR